MEGWTVVAAGGLGVVSFAAVVVVVVGWSGR